MEYIHYIIKYNLIVCRYITIKVITLYIYVPFKIY